MANTLESHINEIVARASSDIAAAVRANIAAEVNRIMTGAGAAAAPATAAKRKPGRPPKAASSAAPAARPILAKPSSQAKRRGKSGRRSSEQVASDNDKLLAYIKDNSGQRSEDIRKGVGLAKPVVAAGLQALRDAGKVKMKGIKRSAIYSPA